MNGSQMRSVSPLLNMVRSAHTIAISATSCGQWRSGPTRANPTHVLHSAPPISGFRRSHRAIRSCPKTHRRRFAYQRSNSAANHQIVTKVFQPQQPTSLPTRAGAARLLFIQCDRESEGIVEIRRVGMAAEIRCATTANRTKRGPVETCGSVIRWSRVRAPLAPLGFSLL